MKVYFLSVIKFFKMSALIDCPICMDCIESTTKNCVTTECGHCFHTNCLMQSVAHNGFGCPYCRTVMAEEPQEDEETVWDDEEDEEEEGDEEEEEVEMFDDNALRGFRFFWNLLNEEEHDEDDEADEQQLEEWAERRETRQETDPNIPSTDFVAQKLRQQGVTFEQLVNVLCNYDHEEYEDETAERLGNELFGKIRIIVSNYRPEQAVEQPTVASQPAVASAPAEPEVDFAAQPKTVQVRNIPRINIHV